LQQHSESVDRESVDDCRDKDHPNGDAFDPYPFEEFLPIGRKELVQIGDNVRECTVCSLKNVVIQWNFKKMLIKPEQRKHFIPRDEVHTAQELSSPLAETNLCPHSEIGRPRVQPFPNPTSGLPRLKSSF
jgi:hypothetical protein